MLAMRHKPFFIPASIVGKFQTCCISEGSDVCGGDACDEVVATLKDGTVLRIPVCSSNEHQRVAVAAKRQLEQGVAPEDIEDVIWEWMFIQPPERSEKCKLPSWRVYLSQQSVPPVIEIPKQKKIISSVQAAAPRVIKEAMVGWQWIEDINKWMSVTGEIVPVHKLSNPELIATAIAIKEANGVTRRSVWVKDLIAPAEEYRWPAGSLKVGVELAGDKLDDFKDSAADRGLLR
jgi:hypothetical protein